MNIKLLFLAGVMAVGFSTGGQTRGGIRAEVELRPPGVGTTNGEIRAEVELRPPGVGTTNGGIRAEVELRPPGGVTTNGEIRAEVELRPPWMVVPFGIFSTDHNRYGAGLAVLHELTSNIAAGSRVDYLNGAIWMPSVSLQLQAPLYLRPFTLVPFTFTGAAVQVGPSLRQGCGGQGGGGSTTPMIGVGLAVRMGERFDLVGDVEQWTALRGTQFRLGAIWKF